MKAVFKVGDKIIRKRMPQYAGLPRSILVIESIDDNYYRFEGGSISEIRLQNHFELYKPSKGLFSQLCSLIHGKLVNVHQNVLMFQKEHRDGKREFRKRTEI